MPFPVNEKSPSLSKTLLLFVTVHSTDCLFVIGGYTCEHISMSSSVQNQATGSRIFLNVLVW